jgi:hypothetical protein
MSRLFWNNAIDVVGVGGQFWIFALSSDGEIIYKSWSGTAWQPSLLGWSSLGSGFVSAPSVAARNFTYEPARAQVDVVAVGVVPDRRGFRMVVYHKFWNGSAWQPQSGWDEIGDLGTAPTRPKYVTPAAITGLTGAHTVDVVAVGPTGEVLHRYLVSGVWQPASGWESLGSGVTSAPALAGVDAAPMGFNVFGVGASNNIVHKYWDGSAWHPSQTTWEDLGGSANKEFSVVTAAGMTSDVRFDVFGTNLVNPPAGNQLMHKAYLVAQPQSWQPLQQWEPVPGVDGFPIAVQSGVPLSRVDVFVTVDRVYHNFKPEFSGNWLSTWEDLGGGLVADIWVPAAAADCVYPAPETAQLHVAYIGRDGMQHKYYDSSGWHPSQSGWDSLGNGINNKGFFWGQTS